MEGASLFRFVLAFVFVLGLIGLGALALKRFGGRMGLVVRTGATPRLKVVETCALGPRHRLVLVARDQVEHLLVVGPDTHTVIETGITHGA